MLPKLRQIALFLYLIVQLINDIRSAACEANGLAVLTRCAINQLFTQIANQIKLDRTF